MPLSAGKPILQAALAKAFVDAMNEYKKFDQTGNSGVDSSVAATTAAGAVFAAPGVLKALPERERILVHTVLLTSRTRTAILSNG